MILKILKGYDFPNNEKKKEKKWILEAHNKFKIAVLSLDMKTFNVGIWQFYSFFLSKLFTNDHRKTI